MEDIILSSYYNSCKICAKFVDFKKKMYLCSKILGFLANEENKF